MLRLLPHGLDFMLEAPCATWRECLSLRRRTDVPIIFDELATNDASIAQLIADDAAEGIGLKISKNGGLTRGRRHRDICVAAGYTVSVQETTGSDIAFAAGALSALPAGEPGHGFAEDGGRQGADRAAF